jgi:hypothetical protein
MQVISLCERLAGQDAKVTTVPVGVLKTTRLLTRLFQWTTDVADRLAFSEVRLATIWLLACVFYFILVLIASF